MAIRLKMEGVNKIMTKRERIITLLQGKIPDCVPTGFSLHFPKEENSGPEGVKAHLKFFQETDTDLVKIMNENLVTEQTVRTPEDWSQVKWEETPPSFVKKQLEFTKEILENYPGDGYSLGTLHGIVASSIHPIEKTYGYDGSRTLLVQHLREKEEPVLDAMKRIAEAMCQLAWGYADLGVDGVYYAALGGETRWFTDEEFERWVMPFDKLILSEIRKAGCSVFLHICKDGLKMERYRTYGELCDVVNWGVYETSFSLEEGQKLFPGKIVMGGLANRSGVMIGGTKEELVKEAQRLVEEFGEKGFILGADCTLPTEIPYERIRWITEATRDTVLEGSGEIWKQ